MAAPLPLGSQVVALPTAPQADPRLFAPDVLKSMQVAQAGMHLGGEIARLQDLQAQLELERAKRKAESAATDFQLQATGHAIENLPRVVQAQMQEVNARAEQAKLAAAQATALFNAKVPSMIADNQALTLTNQNATQKALADQNVPTRTVDLASQNLTNEAASAKAAEDFHTLSPTAKIQASEAAKTLGGWGIASGTIAPDGEVPYVFRDTKIEDEIDNTTGNTVSRAITYDKRNGNLLSKGPVIATKKLGVDEKSVTQAAREATSIVQSLGMASELEKTLKAYGDAGAGGLGQALATNVANKAPTGPVSVISKIIGAKAQTGATVEVVGKIQNLKNTIANTLFGTALSKEESSQLQGMLPTAEDIGDPARALTKLQGTVDFLNAKLKPYRDRGVLEKAGIKVDGPQGTPATPNAGSSPLQIGSVRYNKDGIKFVLTPGIGPGGAPAWKPQL